MLSDEQLDELTTRLLKKIAPMLGLEYEEPQPVTEIEDSNGLVYDLAKLVNTRCLIDTITNIFVAMPNLTSLNADPYWVSVDGTKYTPEELTELIHSMQFDGEVTITVREFQD